MPNKRKEETKELQDKSKKSLVLEIKMKEENIGLPKINNHQDDSTIACINKVYKESFSKFIDFCWIAKFVVPTIGKTNNCATTQIS